jgi:cell division protein ZapA (FtsZ GTPase activity inhibitor)
MNEHHTVKITVYGKEYTIKTSEDPQATLEYASFIDEKMKEIGQKTGSFDPNRIATLALLQITHELFAVRRKFDGDKEQLRLRTLDLETRIDDVLAKSGIQTDEGE